MREKDYVYQLETDMLMRGPNGEMTPVGYERLVTDTLEKHFSTNRSAESEAELLKKGVSWVIISTCIEVKSRISVGEKLGARTWALEKKGLVFRREVGIYHEDGTLAVGAACYFVMIDTEKRRMIRNPEDYVDCSPGGEERLTHGDSRVKLKTDGFETAETIAVRPSWIDAVGHVNNARYLEMAYDALPAGERRNMAKLHRLEAYFINELHEGEEITLSRSEEEGCIVVAVTKKDETKPSFAAKMFFE